MSCQALVEKVDHVALPVVGFRLVAADVVGSVDGPHRHPIASATPDVQSGMSFVGDVPGRDLIS